MKNWTEAEILADLAEQEEKIARGEMKFISLEDEIRDMNRQVRELKKSKKVKRDQKVKNGRKLASSKI